MTLTTSAFEGAMGTPPVRRHPACDDPRWTGLPTKFTLVQAGGTAWTTKDSVAEALDAHRGLTGAGASQDTLRSFGPGCTVVEVPYAPGVRGYGDPRPAVRGPWAGGTWHGECGAMVWVSDPDGAVIGPYRTLTALDRLAGTGGAGWVIPQEITSNEIARSSQTQHMLGNAVTPGFFYECQRRYRHLGDCGGVRRDGTPDGLGITWDRHLPDLVPTSMPTLF